MRQLLLILTVVTLGLFAAPLPPVSVVEATHPPEPQPLLGCADVTGDGAADVGDIVKVVSKFGTYDPNWTANATYHPLYDLDPRGTGAVDVGDIVVAVSDFGLVCGAIAPVSTETAQATLAILNIPDPPGGLTCPSSDILTENAGCLAERGYFQASTDVPGQGVHYVHAAYFVDNLFNPTQPEGLVYEGGRLRAQLYYLDGYAVGWGCWPGPPPNCGGDPPPDQVDIDSLDPLCVPVPPGTACSWSGPYDGWHTHFDLCTIAIGTPQAAAIPGIGSASTCQSLHNTWCGGAKCAGSTWSWNDKVGWMGHLWNHSLNPNVNDMDIAGNGRFADCFPDLPLPKPEPVPPHWDGFNCPQ